ncbi:MAG: CHAP domain protein [Cressdnaviricota sp.]|nr:MAG: CHAP domain protein [Cressdnaviricota sp.]
MFRYTCRIFHRCGATHRPCSRNSKGVLQVVVICVHWNVFQLGAMHTKTHHAIIRMKLFTVLFTTAENIRLKFRRNVYNVFNLISTLTFTPVLRIRHFSRWGKCKWFLYVRARRLGLELTPGMPPVPREALRA